MLRVSPHTQIIPCRDGYVAYHSLFGRPLIINEEAYSFLKSFAGGKSNDFTSEEKAVAAEFASLYLVVEEEFDERALLEEKCREYEREIATGSLVNYLSLIMAESCNFGCRYCFAKAFHDKRTTKTPNALMQLPTAYRAIDEFMALIQKHQRQEAYINFGGGEPLLNFMAIKNTVKYCEAKYPKQFFKFAVNTNSSLITPAIARFLRLHSFDIATSLDGTKTWNDRVRVYRNPNIKTGTYDAIVAGLGQLKSAGNKITGFSVTVTPENLAGIDESLIDWFHQEGFVDIRLDLDAIHCYNEIDPKEIALRLVQLKRYGKERGIYISGFWERAIENMFPSILESQTSFCGGKRGNSMCVAPSGDIYLCGYSGTKVGTIFGSMIPNAEYCRLVSQQLLGRNPRCKGCSIEGQCIGGCYIAEEISSAEKTSVLEFNCLFYKAATLELLKDQVAIA